jgi:chemotaxis protein CheY-P-specific phosphatase CheC
MEPCKLRTTLGVVFEVDAQSDEDAKRQLKLVIGYMEGIEGVNELVIEETDFTDLVKNENGNGNVSRSSLDNMNAIAHQHQMVRGHKFPTDNA